MRPNLGQLGYRVHGWLTETGTVTRPGGEPVWDPTINDYVDPPPVVVHDGPMLVRPQANAERVVESGQTTYTVTRYDITLPASTPVEQGDTVTVTSAVADPTIVGVRFTVLDVPLDVWQVARRAVAARVT